MAITRNFGSAPSIRPGASLAEKSKSPIADIIEGRSAYGSFRYLILPVLTVLIGLAFLLLEDTSSSDKYVLILMGVQLMLLI